MTAVSTRELDAYTRRHPHFLTAELPPLLARRAGELRPRVLADLGCGDGSNIYALERAGCVAERVLAVDLAPQRVERARTVSARVVGIVGDATNVPQIEDASVDGVVVSQVIEHVPDDRALAPEIARILRPGGWWYVGSVLRGRRAWWIYRRDGRWQLDPTHVREYPSVASFTGVLRHPALVLDELSTAPFRFPVLDLAARATAMSGALAAERVSRLYERGGRLAQRLRKVRMPVPGYDIVEAFGHREAG